DTERGRRALASGIAEAAGELECDTVVMLDVGGDVLAHGAEAGLASPLCDAIVLSSGLFLGRAPGKPGSGIDFSGDVIGAVYGPGCARALAPHQAREQGTPLQS